MQGDRYDAQRAVIGSKLQNKLQDMQVIGSAYIRHHVHTHALLSMTRLPNFGGKVAVSSSVVWQMMLFGNTIVLH